MQAIQTILVFTCIILSIVLIYSVNQKISSLEDKIFKLENKWIIEVTNPNGKGLCYYNAYYIKDNSEQIGALADKMGYKFEYSPAQSAIPAKVNLIKK